MIILVYRNSVKWWVLLACILGSLFFHYSLQAENARLSPPANGLSLAIDGPIGPATAEYIENGIWQANAEHSPVILLTIDTPGGLDKSMRTIVQAILKSDVPVVSYVAPSGARAASAGTFILLASSVAAMAPGTNLGAATPVNLMSTPVEGKAKDDQPDSLSAKEKKVRNDASAYIRSLAQMHGRNENWAMQAVMDGASLSAKEALDIGVVDFISHDAADILKQVDGQLVNANGRNVILHTQSTPLTAYSPDWRVKFLMIITNPSVAYILLMVAFYGLFLEFTNPGAVIPGVVGVVSLIIALYAFQLLPVNFAGLGLIILGLIFMAIEAFMPSVGAFGLGGVVSFVCGSIFLFDRSVAGFQVSYQIIAAVTVLSVLFFVTILQLAVRSDKRKPVTGAYTLIGQEGCVIEKKSKKWVEVQGELWPIRSGKGLASGQRVIIIDADHLAVTVKVIDDIS